MVGVHYQCIDVAPGLLASVLIVDSDIDVVVVGTNDSGIVGDSGNVDWDLAAAVAVGSVDGTVGCWVLLWTG